MTTNYDDYEPIAEWLARLNRGQHAPPMNLVPLPPGEGKEPW